MEFFAQLQPVQGITVDDMTAITICHGSPYKINEKMLPNDNKTIEIMNSVKTSIVLCGHSHIQSKIVHNEKCVGVCSVFENDLNTMNVSPWLADLYVDKNFRRMGIAQLLINEILLTCKNIGYNKIFLRTETAKEYYVRNGWRFIDDSLNANGAEAYQYL